MKTFRFLPSVMLLSLFGSTPATAQPYVPVETESAVAHAHFAQGVRSLDAGRVDDAREHFNQAISADGELAVAHLFRAYAATSGAEYMAHLGHATDLRTEAAPFVQILIDMEQAGLDNDADRRLDLAKNLVALYSWNPRAHLILGQELQSARKIAAARTAFAKSNELDSGFTPAYAALTQSLLFDEPKHVDRARNRARMVRNRIPEEAMGHILLGDVQRAAGDFEGARDYYAKATQVAPTEQVGYAKRGHANVIIGAYAEARGDFQAASRHAKTVSDRAALDNFSAITHLYAGDIDAALTANQRAISRLTSDGAEESEITFPMLTAYWQRVTMAMHHNRFAVAEAAMTERAKWVDRAVTQVNDPDWEVGIRADVVLLSGMLAARGGDVRKARTLAEEHRSMIEGQSNPRRYEGYHRLLGMIAYAENDFHGAIEHLKQADPDNLFVQHEKGMAYEAAGMADKARDEYTRIAEFNFNSIGASLHRNAAIKKLQVTTVSM